MLCESTAITIRNTTWKGIDIREAFMHVDCVIVSYLHPAVGVHIKDFFDKRAEY